MTGDAPGVPARTASPPEPGPAGPAGAGPEGAAPGPERAAPQVAPPAGRRGPRALLGWARRHRHGIAVAGVTIAALAGIVGRFATPSHLWLDEALTVDIANRPVGGLLAALRHDGSPPLYYLILHVWIKVFGDGDIAVRALSGVLSVLTLPVAWIAGRRVGLVAQSFGNAGERTPRRVALATFLLFVSSPYAIRYGSETRMYSMVVLVVLLFGLALLGALERGGRVRLLLLCLATTALVYTHYWTFLLVFTVAFFLLVQARRRPNYRRPALRAFAAMAASAVPFGPWMPSFAFQMLHTGTPWAPRVQAQVLLDTVFDWAGPTSTGALLGLLLLAGALVGLTARPHGDHLDVAPRGRVPGRYLAAVWLVPLMLAYFAYLFGGSAYADRYTGIALPAFLLLSALGISLLPNPMRTVVLVVALVTGLAGGFNLAQKERTQAGQIATRIAALARPDDVVAYCPDQLAPAVYRAISRRSDLQVRQIAYADPAGPALVDWVDYAQRMEQASGAQFAAEVNTMAGPDHAIFLVRADGYRTLEGACAVLSDQLAVLRDRTVQVEKSNLFEGASLERFSTLR